MMTRSAQINKLIFSHFVKRTRVSRIQLIIYFLRVSHTRVHAHKLVRKARKIQRIMKLLILIMLDEKSIRVFFCGGEDARHQTRRTEHKH